MPESMCVKKGLYSNNINQNVKQWIYLVLGYRPRGEAQFLFSTVTLTHRTVPGTNETQTLNVIFTYL